VFPQALSSGDSGLLDELRRKEQEISAKVSEANIAAGKAAAVAKAKAAETAAASEELKAANERKVCEP
jgi:septal ring factor EnvC (AmiA/AmiB activator)